jgi:hypothetical protein
LALVGSRRLQMKRLVVAVVALAALAVGAEAGSLFEPIHLVYHQNAYHYTHYVRGPQKGKKHSGGEKANAEARQTTPQPVPSPKASPQPARAD